MVALALLPTLTTERSANVIIASTQVLLDGNYVHFAVMGHVDLHESLPKLLQTRDVTLFVTKCVYAELQQLGADFDESVDVASSFKFAKCSHKTPVSASECLTSLVGTSPLMT